MFSMRRPRLETKSRFIRFLRWIVLVVVSAAVLYLTISYVAIPLLILLSPTLHPTLYELGFYGGSPSQTYISNGLSSPRISTRKYDSSCDQGYIFLNFNGDSVPSPGPAILSASNELVWKAENFETTTNSKVQRYKGEQYLTFWAGKKGGTMGSGTYQMASTRQIFGPEYANKGQLNASYDTKHLVSAVGVQADLHEFVVTRDDTALLTFYNVTPADLSSLGKPKNGWLIDSGFQEVDIATGQLLFEWRASDHFQVNETFMTHPFAGYIKSIPFDFFHINSVDKDFKGNYLISSRHTRTVSCISPSGQILWILGGRRNQFRDPSGGDVLNFRWQHDARWVDEEAGIISLFDNKEAGPLHIDGPYSRGMMLQLDIGTHTVTLLQEYVSLHQTRTPSQGSAQYLPESQHMFVGFGHSPVMSEFALNGTLLCETHFGAPWLHAFNTAVSYRAFKSAHWVGSPREPPTAKIQDDVLYVSWNGATKVSEWMLQGANEQVEQYVDLDVVYKESYEETFELGHLSEYARFRVAALDREGEVLGYSNVALREPSGSWWSFSVAVLLWGAVFRLAWTAYRWFSRGRTGNRGVSWVGWRKS